MATAGNRLSEAHIAELRRAFSIFDVTGTGVITTKDLKGVVKGFLDEEITNEEWKQVLLTVDRNGDGVVEWSEFLEVMTEWLGEDLRPELVKRRKLSSEQERYELHRKIKGFFCQFRKSGDVNEVRNKLQRHGSIVSVVADVNNQMQLSDDRASTSQGKLNFLLKFREDFQLFPRAVEAIFTESFERRMEGCSYFAELLSIVEVFSTPMERRAVADEIVHLFEAIIQNNIPRRLVELINYNLNPALQCKALSALINFSAGPRIASTPESSFLHPSKYWFKKVVMDLNLVQYCIRLLETPQQQQVVELTVVLLGTLAAYNPECRDRVLQIGVLPTLLRLVRSDAPISLLKDLSYTLSIFCGVTHPLNALPRFSVVQSTIEPLACMLFCNNEDVVRNILLSLSLVLPGRPADINVSKRFVQLLDADSPSVVKMTLQTLADLIKADQGQTMMLIQCGLFPRLRQHMTSKEKDIRIATCDIISQLASARGQIQPLLDAGIVEDVLKLVSFDENVRWKLVKIIKYITRGTPTQIKFLMKHNAIHILCKTLTDFRSFDRVLTEAYKFVGPTYNFELLVDVLTSLSNIVNVGEMEAEDAGGINQYALGFDMDAIDKLKHLIEDIIGGTSTGGSINAWRLHTGDDNEKPELRLRSLFQKIRVAFERIPTKDKAQEHMLASITSIWNQFFIGSGNPSLTQTFRPEHILETQLPTSQPLLVQTVVPPAPSSTPAPAPAPSTSPAKPVSSSSSADLTSTTTAPPSNPGGLLLLKCYMDDDIRVLEVSRGITFKELKALIERKYQKNVKIQYQDAEGDYITMDSTKSLTTAIKYFDAAHAATSMKLKILENLTATNTQLSSSSSPKSSATPEPKDRQHFKDERDKLSASDPGPHFNLSDTPPSKSSLSASEGRGVKRAREEPGNDVQSSLLSSLGPVPETPLFSLSKDLEYLRNEQRKQMFHDLEQTTHFGQKELEELHNWVKTQNPSAIVDRDAFTKALKAINITDELMIEQYFSAFDSDKNGSIDFREFACGLSIVLKGTADERLQLLFNSYDLDGDGVLDQTELFNMFKCSMKSSGKVVTDTSVKQMVKETFEAVDENNDGEISWEEFHKAVHSGKLSFTLFSS